MKVVTVQLVAADEADATAINAQLEDSGLLNEWPVFAWDTREADLEHMVWYREEYLSGQT